MCDYRSNCAVIDRSAFNKDNDSILNKSAGCAKMDLMAEPERVIERENKGSKWSALVDDFRTFVAVGEPEEPS